MDGPTFAHSLEYPDARLRFEPSARSIDACWMGLALTRFDADSLVAGAAKIYVSFRMIRLELEAFERHKGIDLVHRGAAKS